MLDHKPWSLHLCKSDIDKCATCLRRNDQAEQLRLEKVCPLRHMSCFAAWHVLGAVLLSYGVGMKLDGASAGGAMQELLP